MNIQLPVHPDLSGAFKPIKAQLDRVQKIIDEQLTVCPDKIGINRLFETFSNCGGKMLRPALVLLAGSGCGKITDEHIRVAAIVEIIHNATLLHDDVIDEGQERRGLPTVNNLWGNESAVLLGDFLLSKVFSMCAGLEPQIFNIIATAAVRTCQGELRQVIQRRNWQLSESEYIDIITEKSAALFSSCCNLGVFLAQASKAQGRSLACFGLNLGVAFQITDDVLDIVGDETETGKTIGSDVDKNKLTLPVIHLLTVADEREKSTVMGGLNTAGQNRSILAEMLRSYGSLEYANNRAREFVAKAVAALADLQESNAKNALIKIAGFVAGRAA